MKLIVQMPALNEAKSIAGVIAAVPRAIPGVDSVDVVVVDDGSTDETAALARSLGSTVLSHDRRRGVGAAFRTGIEHAMACDADLVVTIDSDGQFNPADIPTLIAPVLRGEADFVSASRFMDPSLMPEMTRTKTWGNHFMSRWVSRLVNRRFYDVSCGFRAYSREAYLRLVLLGDFTYTHEVFLNLAFAGVRMAEVPIRVRGIREHGQSRVAGNLFRYGWRTSAIILRAYRDYKPMQFFGSMAGTCAVAAVALGAFLLSVKIRTGGFTPHKWAGFASASFAFLSLLLLFIGMVAEMMDRARVARHEMLYRIRRIERTLASPRSSSSS
jgi:glycosyltransferase involved in cell wall biosynthesis